MEWTRRTGIVLALTLVTAAFVNVLFHRNSDPSDQEDASSTQIVDLGPIPGGPPKLLIEDEATPLRSDFVTPAVNTPDPDADPSAPQPVPVPADAVPIANRAGPDAVRAVIEEELAGSSREERDIWYEELKSIPAGVVRDLLQVRKQLRSLPRALHRMDPLPTPPRVADVTAEPVSQSRRAGASDWSSTLAALELAMSISRHNLANSTTPGFKRIRALLVDTQGIQWQDESGDHGSSAAVSPGGCRIAETILDLEQGVIRTTGRPLDVAVDGEGFLVGKAGDRVVYTRYGVLIPDAQRRLCFAIAADAVPLDPEIVLPADAREIQISATGHVQAVSGDGSDPVPLGQILLARFPSPERLTGVGGGLLAPNARSGAADVGEPSVGGRGGLQQGSLELSNVETERELEAIEQWQTLLKSFPVISRPLTASGQDAHSR